MHATDFIAKWRPGSPAHDLNERAGAQAHFIDLCRLLGVPEPDDPQRYCFERGVTQTGSSTARTNGFADVWLQGHFAWEYKAPGRSLEGALKQLMMYALPLENPPLLVVSDRLRMEVHTHFTGTPSERHTFALEDMARPEVQQRLRALWLQPDAFRSKRSNRDITEEAARTFAGTAERRRASGTPPERVSHFLTQCLFCFFAEDVGLLPARLFERLVGIGITAAQMRSQLGKLFEAMRDGGLFARQTRGAAWAGRVIVNVDLALVEVAGEFADTSGLRACDSVQLAAAQRLHRSLGSELLFACVNSRLRKAARWLVMGVV